MLVAVVIYFCLLDDYSNQSFLSTTEKIAFQQHLVIVLSTTTSWNQVYAGLGILFPRRIHHGAPPTRSRPDFPIHSPTSDDLNIEPRI